MKFNDESPYSRGLVEACFSYRNEIIPPLGTPNYTDPTENQLCNSLNWLSTSTSFTIPTSNPGVYTLKLDYTVVPFTDCSMGFPNLPTYVLNIVNQTLSTANQIDGGIVCDYPNTQQISTTYVLNTTGGTFNLNFVLNLAAISGFTLTVQQPAPRFFVSGSTIEYAIEFPDNDYKQIDFITSINRYFNLVVVPDPDYPNRLIIEPIIDYIGKGQVLDWTTKIDRSQPITIVPTTTLINGTLNYEFKLDQDWANQNFQKASNRIFGTERKNLNIDYKNSETKFDFMFSSPLDITIYSAEQSYLTLPSFSKLQQKDQGGNVEQQFVPFKILPRLLFRGVTMNNLTYGFIGGTGSTPTQYQRWYVNAGGTSTQDHFLEMNRFTTYPWNYNNFSHYTNWRGSDQTTITPAEDAFVSEDLYNIYYQPYINDLTSEENKIVSAKIYLYPYEIKQLRYDEKILIDNTYYRINKISNYNLLEPSLCDIELIKLTREMEGHRIIRYRLDPCTPPNDTLWSNSDLMYNLFAYIGNYVKVYDDNLNYIDCYQVFEDTSGLGIGLEQHYYISSGFTNTGVGSYTDCGCNTEAPMIVVQETPVPSPTPSPTPSITPSPTLTPFLTPSVTPSVSPTSVTPTPTPTNTPTPSNTPAYNCSCWFFLNETAGPLFIEYTACGDMTTTIESVGGGQARYRCLTDGQPINADPGMTYVPCLIPTDCSVDAECTGCAF